MRLINTKAHGIYDYLLALIIVCSPALFNYETGSNADLAGLLVFLYLVTTGLSTRFELGLFKKISLKTHLWLDIAAGVFLAVSPWLCRFSEHTYKPQLVFGMSLVVVSVLTDRLPAQEAAKIMGKGKTRNTGDRPKKNEFEGFKFIGQSSDHRIFQQVKKHLRTSIR